MENSEKKPPVQAREGGWAEPAAPADEDAIGRAVSRYNEKMAVVWGEAYAPV